MKKAIFMFAVILIILSGCGIFTKNNTPYVLIKTPVEITDPYGNKVFVKGKVNGFDIILKDGSTGIGEKITEIKSISLDTNIFDYDYALVDGKININLRMKSGLPKNIAEVQKDLAGNIIVYTYNINATKFNIWLDNMLEKGWIENRNILSSEENIIAGNYLISFIRKTPPGTTYFKTGASGNVKVKRIQLK
ncbi:hypothetical protein SU69_03500 [Thermosipho melanesiensis]|uniref:Lipoprotein n=2 Tax=Thermosipho melanesiensis TaxID=46541 RepID=A6LKU1_THEM4|nr:hypothetical protein [Thermosipho melanesiensis]ABR30542.1 hypothetical protein Tmel_0678 [Thermosipho melanesiensis BI429]APT73691.1 hypothetical protein BW47_03685 [Thermosipho melanesiensis]OOC35630.1 hypothetical protein SU68_03555 [Thermosipho melanesiensis]OOC39305.1 hypothetical protein SU69_03500 [Thermosipho melanesiensis]OOC39391.1 hypothetical protein SU70_03500 [Thermosipho melanesiensis]